MADLNLTITGDAERQLKGVVDAIDRLNAAITKTDQSIQNQAKTFQSSVQALGTFVAAVSNLSLALDTLSAKKINITLNADNIKIEATTKNLNGLADATNKAANAGQNAQKINLREFLKGVSVDLRDITKLSPTFTFPPGTIAQLNSARDALRQFLSTTTISEARLSELRDKLAAGQAVFTKTEGEQKFVSILGSILEAYRKLTAQVDQATIATQKLTSIRQKLADANTFTGQVVKSVLPATDLSQLKVEGNEAKLRAFNRAINELERAAVKAGVPLSELNKIFTLVNGVPTANLERLGDKTLASLGDKILLVEQRAKALKAALDVQSRAAAASSGAFQPFINALNSLVQVPAGATVSSTILDRFSNSITRVQKELARVTIDPGQLNNIFQTLQANTQNLPAAIATLPPEFQKLATAMAQVIRNSALVDASLKRNADQAQKTAANVAKQAANQTTQTNVINPLIAAIEKQVVIRTDASTTSITSFRNALLNLQKSLQGTNQSLPALQALFDRIAQNPAKATLSSLPPDLQKIAQAMLAVVREGEKISDTFNRVGRDGGRAGAFIDLSWQAVGKLFVGQTIISGLSQIRQEILASIDAMAQLQVQISQLRTLSINAQLSFDSWRNSIRQLSSEFIKPQAEVAKAAYETLSNQVAKGADTFNFLRSAGRLANITVSDLTTSADLLAGVINAYQFNANEADRISNILFRTVDLGRVKVGDLSNTIGRAAVTASQLGITFEELTAGLVTISITGVRPDTTLTLLNNVMLKLLKPTQDMTELLRSLGFSSGQAAISALGFDGVLRLLAQEAQKGSSVVADLSGELRAIQGVFALTADGGSRFSTALSQIRSGANDADTAARLIEESAGRQFLRTINNLKLAIEEFGNIFVEIFSGSFLIVEGAFSKLTTILAPILPSVTRLSDIFRLLLQSVAAVGLAFLTATTAIIGANVAITAAIAVNTAYLGVVQLATGINLGFSVSFATLKASVLSFTAVLTTFNVIVAATAAGIVVAFQRANELNTALNEMKTGIKKFQDDIRESQDRFLRELAEKQTKLAEEIREQTRRVFASAIDATRSIVTFADAQVRAEQEASKRINDSFKEIFDNYSSHLNQKISKLKENIRSSEDEIRRSVRTTEQLGERQREALFQRALRFETDPRRAINAVTERINVLRSEANELFNRAVQSTNPETAGQFAAEARQRIQEIERLVEERLQRQIDIRQRLAEVGREQLLVETDVTGRIVRRLDVSAQINQAQLEQNRLHAELRANETRFQESQRALAENRRRELATEEQRLRTLQAKAKELFELNPFDLTGRPNRQFQDTRGNFDFERFQRTQRQLANQFFAQLRPDQNSGQIVLQVEQALQAQLAQIRQEARTRQAADEARADQERLNNRLQASNRLLQQELNSANTLRTALSQADATTSTNLQQILNQVIRTGQSSNPLTDAGDIGTNRNLRASLTRAQEALTAAGAAVRSGRQITPEEQTAINRNVTEFLNFARRILEERLRRSDPNVRVNQDFELVREIAGAIRVSDLRPSIGGQEIPLSRLIEQIRDASNIQRQQSLVTESGENVQRLRNQITEQENRIQAFVNQVTGQARAIARGVEEINVSFNSQLQIEDAKLTAVLDKLVAINRELATIRANPIQIPVNPVAPPARAIGGPIGMDTQLVRAARDEFFVNPNSSRRFFSQLVAINAGFQPRGMAIGGQVTNNTVGDINISIPNQSINARDIANQIRREIRKGLI